jgi:hypothetical protein
MSEERMEKKLFHEFLYDVENILDEFLIGVLSFGAILVTVYTLAYSGQSVTMMSFGKVIEPWITMLALMIIGRELWIFNRKMDNYMEQLVEER